MARSYSRNNAPGQWSGLLRVEMDRGWRSVSLAAQLGLASRRGMVSSLASRTCKCLPFLSAMMLIVW